MKKTFIFLLALVMALGISLVAAMPVAADPGMTYYVSNSGSDVTGTGAWDNPWATIQHAVDQVSSGDTIQVASGTYAGAIVDKDTTISGSTSGTSTINTGVPYKAGSGLTTAFRLDAGADGAQITDFVVNNNAGASFYFAIFARTVDDVTIDSLEINDTVQGITNWGGSGWTITNNTITDTVAAGGGGIGIMLGALNAPSGYGICCDNLVQYNTIDASASAEDYSCPAICLGLDLRWGGYLLVDGSEDISGNQILDNTITASAANNLVGIEVGTILGNNEEDPIRDDPDEIAAVMAAAADHDNTVQGNDVDGADIGIYFYNATNLTITQNTVQNNVGYGMYGEHGQNGTVITDNTFTNNEIQLADETDDTETLDSLDIASILTNNTFDRTVTVDHPDASLLHTIWSHIQDAIDAASAGDTINVAAGTYTEYLHITTDGLTIQGAGIDQSIIDLDGLTPYWHYSGSGSFASRAGVLISGYGSSGEVIEDVAFKGFTVKNAGLNPPITATGTHTGADNAAVVLTDSTKSWTIDALVGQWIHNYGDRDTDYNPARSYGQITANTATTVTVASLSGGKENDWDTGDPYLITPYEEFHNKIWVHYPNYDGLRGIGIGNGKNVTIQNCKVTNCGYGGIGSGYARLVSTHKYGEDITVDNCIVTDHLTSGISIGQNVGALTITNNLVERNERPNYEDANRENAGRGIEVSGSKNYGSASGLIADNTVNDNGFEGIILSKYTDGVTVEDNTVTGHNLDEDGAGIFFYGDKSNPANCKNNIIRNNTVTGNIRGIVAYYAQACTIEGNNITTDSGAFALGQAAIKIDGGNNIAVNNNAISCDGVGIKVQKTWNGVDCYDNTFTGNTIDGAMFAGVYITSGAHDNTFTCNTIRNTVSHTFTQWADWGVHDGGDDQATLADSGKSWTTDALVGMTVMNLDDGSEGVITANTATTVTATLSGGTEDDWDNGDDYDIVFDDTHADGVYLRGGMVYAGGHAGTGNVFNHNNIYDNPGHGLSGQLATTVDARYNWWGDASGPYNATTNPSGTGDSVSDNVDYSPWWGANYIGVGHPWDWYTNDSVQDAIDTASAGDTINVMAGMYVEVGQIVISNNLTIIGEDKDTTIIKPAQNTGGSGDARGWFLVEAGNEFNLSNVTLDGEGKNVHQAIRSFGSGTIDNNIIKNIRYSLYIGFGMVVMGDYNMTFSNNTFTDIERIGMMAFGSGVTDAQIIGNTYTGKGDVDGLDYGIEIGGGAKATITGNNITNCTAVASSDGSESAGILVTDYWGPGTEATITGNTLTGNTMGIAIGYDGSDLSVATISSNTLENNRYQVDCTASVDVDLEATLANNTFDRAVVVRGSGIKVPTIFSSIQDAIDAAVAGDTVEVMAGTYDEQVTIDKSLTIQGEGDSTVVQPSSTTVQNLNTYSYFSLDFAPVVYADGLSSVTIKELKIDGSEAATFPSGTDRYVGLLLVGTNATVDHVTSANFLNYPGSNLGYNMYVYADSETVSVEIDTCFISGVGRGGVQCVGDGLTMNIHDCVVTGPGVRHSGEWIANGILIWDDATGEIVGNTVSDFAYDGTGWVAQGIDASGATLVTDNTVTDCQTGIGAWGDGVDVPSGTISDNTISATGLVGYEGDGVTGIAVDAWGGGTATVTISDNDLSGGGPGDGIRIGQDFDDPDAIDATISGNTIIDWDTGIFVGDSADEADITENEISSSTIGSKGIYIPSTTTVTGININLNNIAGNDAYGVDNDASGNVDATANWWGAANGPYHDPLNLGGEGDTVSDNVLFEPWYSDEGMTTLVGYSTYEFVYDVPGVVVACEDTVVPVTFQTDELGAAGYYGVRFKFDATGPGDVIFKATDSEMVEHTFVDSGYWPPSAGFNLTADYSDTTDWSMNFSEPGEYNITFSLIEAPDGDVVAGIEDSEEITVRAVDILDYYRHSHEPFDEVTTLDLLAAADDWIANEVPPGFDDPITTMQLLALADEWFSS